MQDLSHQVQINIPFTMRICLWETAKIDFYQLFTYLKLDEIPQPIITLEPHQEEDLWPSLEYLARLWPWE